MPSADCLVFATFLMVSTTSLLPWNLFMTAFEVSQAASRLSRLVPLQYFTFKLRPLNGSSPVNMSIPLAVVNPLQGYNFEHSFEAWMTVCSGISCVLGSLSNALLTMRYHLATVYTYTVLFI